MYDVAMNAKPVYQKFRLCRTCINIEINISQFQHIYIIYLIKKHTASDDDQVLVYGSLVLCIFHLYNYRILSEPVQINDLPVDSTYQKPQIRSCTWRQRKSRWRVLGSEAGPPPGTGRPGSSASSPGKCRINTNKKRQTYESLFKTLVTLTQKIAFMNVN